MAYYLNRMLVFIMFFGTVEPGSELLERIRILEYQAKIMEKVIEVTEYKFSQKIREQEQKIASLSTSSSLSNAVDEFTNVFEVRLHELEGELTHLRESFESKYEKLERWFANIHIYQAEEKKFRKRAEQTITTMLESEEGRHVKYLELTDFLQNRVNHIDKLNAMLNANFTSASSYISEANDRYKMFLSDVENKMANMSESTVSLHEGYRDYVIPKTDCKQLYDAGVRYDGVYNINPDITTGRSFEVFCDMTAGGWTVIQRRKSNEVDFYQPWTMYAKGFGYLTGNHWLGLNHIHRLTSRLTELYMRVVDTKGDTFYAVYHNFSVSNERDFFAMHVNSQNKYSNFTFADNFTYHNGSKFSTYDRDNDIMKGSCAKERHGGWWYLNCYCYNFNGKYGVRASNGIAIWDNLAYTYTYYDETVMMIRSL